MNKLAVSCLLLLSSYAFAEVQTTNEEPGETLDDELQMAVDYLYKKVDWLIGRALKDRETLDELTAEQPGSISSEPVPRLVDADGNQIGILNLSAYGPEFAAFFFRLPNDEWTQLELIGQRLFTSPLHYDGENCSGTPYVLAPDFDESQVYLLPYGFSAFAPDGELKYGVGSPIHVNLSSQYNSFLGQCENLVQTWLVQEAATAASADTFRGPFRLIIEP